MIISMKLHATRQDRAVRVMLTECSGGSRT